MTISDDIQICQTRIDTSEVGVVKGLETFWKIYLELTEGTLLIHKGERLMIHKIYYYVLSLLLLFVILKLSLGRVLEKNMVRLLEFS